MQGGIRNISSLKKWFFTIGKPFFTLSYLGGSANQVILRNTAIDGMEEAWEMLETQVLAQSEVGRATMQLIVYGKDKANNPDGRTNIDMLPAQNQAAVAGIGSIQGGYIDKSTIAGILAEERQRWELEQRIIDLENQINSPSDDWTEKLMAGIERIGSTQLGQMLAMKYLGTPLPPMTATAVSGTPAPADDDNDTFETDIEKSAALLGIDDTQLARKVRQLIEANPEVARQLLNS